MEITNISRKISGYSYDNLSATVNVASGEDPIEIAKQLDLKLHQMLSAIQDQEKAVDEKRQEKEETVSLLKRALEFAEKMDIPF